MNFKNFFVQLKKLLAIKLEFFEVFIVLIWGVDISTHTHTHTHTQTTRATRTEEALTFDSGERKKWKLDQKNRIYFAL